MLSLWGLQTHLFSGVPAGLPALQEGSLSKSQPPLLGTISLLFFGPRLGVDSAPGALGTEAKPDPKRQPQ